MQKVVDSFPLASGSRLARALEAQQSAIHLGGPHAPLTLALLLASPEHERLSRRPHVIITPDIDIARQLEQDLRFFDPDVPIHTLTHFDVPIYSGLYPNKASIAARLRWLYHAMNARGGEIFIAPIESLLQKTIPFEYFAQNFLKLERGYVFKKSPSHALQALGYIASPTVEDVGTFALRGGVLDIYSPAHELPIRIELFGDSIESLRFFNPETQVKAADTLSAVVLPAREALYRDEQKQKTAALYSKSIEGRDIPKEEGVEILRSLSLGQTFFGSDFLLPYFYDRLSSPLEYFNSEIDLWHFDRAEILRIADELHRTSKDSFASSESHAIRVSPNEIYATIEALQPPEHSAHIFVEKVSLLDQDSGDSEIVEIKSVSNAEFIKSCQSLLVNPDALVDYFNKKFGEWLADGYKVFISTSSTTQAQRLLGLCERANLACVSFEENNYAWKQAFDESHSTNKNIFLIPRLLSSDARINEEKLIFLRDVDIFNRRAPRATSQANDLTTSRGEALSFGDLRVGDYVVHSLHGVGIYQGLKVMAIDGADAEFIEISYKDKDRLYLPVYRIGQLHKFVGPSAAASVDKLGGSAWQKTKIKVRNALRDMAAKLLKLYAKRSQATRAPYTPPGDDYWRFENTFPYQETPDQLRAIEDVLADFTKDVPADRLICGDVGFGKTEVAMRAAFRAVQNRQQVAIIAPTTILTFQHFENFKKRFKDWPVDIRVVNRFVSNKDVKSALSDTKSGLVDILIGTHRLLSKDVGFKDLGLLVIDEEQKFGVAHKERLRHLREVVDTIALSATPIPRTLNMSLVGLRDISFVNTPPEDRLPTRTFVSRFDEETLRKAIEGELARGGQVFFLHNRVQTIDETAARIREIVPHARLAIAHGQMHEDQLEKTIVRFFNHEIDVLVCTAIIESGMDIPRANTIFIDNAHTFGVSQLYQLRGRVGRSKERAYCYLLIPAGRKIDPTALERLKVIQDNAALGSGVRIAQYDLELRGAGDILGEDQSGHINAVGYELFLELLDEAIQNEKGEPAKIDSLEPEINLKISALIPDSYIPDLRMRLYYYKTLSNIKDTADLDQIEDELKDQFGPLPDAVVNLMGIMLVRKYCRDLGVRDISAGRSFVSLSFIDQTPLPPEVVIDLTTRENKKYQLTPTQSLKIRMNELTWPRVVDELEYLLRLCPKTLH